MFLPFKIKHKWKWNKKCKFSNVINPFFDQPFYFVPPNSGVLSEYKMEKLVKNGLIVGFNHIKLVQANALAQRCSVKKMFLEILHEDPLSLGQKNALWSCSSRFNFVFAA